MAITMRKMRVRFGACALAGIMGAAPALALEGDPAAGQFVHVGGAGPETACFLCHGLAGQGDSQAAYPRLAGQSAYYLYKQLKDYAGQTRPDAIMGPIARKLSEKQMRDAAVWFTQISGPDPHDPREEREDAALGRRLATAGDAERRLPPCDSCHGAGGAGSFPAIPYLAGQNAAYIGEQLVRWRRGVRNTDPLGMMTYIAGNLTDAEIEALASHYAALSPPGRDSQVRLGQDHPPRLDQMHDQEQGGNHRDGGPAAAQGGDE